jgi:putative adhesin
MDAWKVEDTLETDVEELRQVIVRIVAGEVTVTAGPTSRIEITRESGAPVDVRLRDGILNVAHPDADMAPLERMIKWLTEGRRHRCTVAITASPDAKINLVAVSAPVVVSGFAGGTRVKTVSGDVTMSSLASSVDVKTVSGDIEAKGINAELKAKTVSGDLTVVDGSCRWVDAKTVSGEVMLDLDLDPSGSYDITTVSGNVAVRTISEPNLAVDAKTVSGEVISDFGLGFDSKPGRRQLYDTIGTGGARLHVKTVSGDLRVLRGRAAA